MLSMVMWQLGHSSCTLCQKSESHIKGHTLKSFTQSDPVWQAMADTSLGFKSQGYCIVVKGPIKVCHVGREWWVEDIVHSKHYYPPELIVEVLIPNQDPIGNLQGTKLSTWLGLNFDQVGINSAMTHVMLLSVKVRRNERSK